MKQSAERRLINERQDVFERWIRERAQITQKKKSSQRTQATYQIPIVVHVIHNGVADPTNIPDEQILSQIRVLNADFNRTNTDASQTPAEFQDEAGSMDVEFVLAKQDPEGFATTGIVRVLGTQSSWSINDNYKLKALSYWPSEDYLNIWVCKLTGYIGYAQFPQSDMLSGLENASTNRLTDGVVIAYTAFGSDDDGDFSLQSKYNKGRTATHEVGHFFGLRHIWGDQDNCSTVGDYVDDTPDQNNETTGCPAHPRQGCTTATMFQNYLDYTNDVCMNLFTEGQIERMITVIENSPRRASLLNSHGLFEPEPVANDVGIKRIITPLEGTCSSEITPEIEIVNYGTNAISSVELALSVNGSLHETKVFNVSLDPLESITLTFSPTPIPGATSSFLFEVVRVNTQTDPNAFNNSQTQNVFLPESVPTPFVEEFSTFPEGWLIINPDQTDYTWELKNAPHEEGDNLAMKMNFYDYADNLGEIDLLITPNFDLTNAPVAILLFDVAYAQYSGSNDGLKVIALDACNPDITKGIVLFDKSGSTLFTTGSTPNSFTPDSQDDWRTESIDLSQFITQGSVQLAFVGVNDYGNNVYLDNVRILTEDVENLTLESVISPSPVNCAASLQPVLRIKNSGTVVSSFTVDYNINGVDFTQEVTNLNLSGGQTYDLLLPQVSLDQGDNTMHFSVLNPNGLPDVNMNDNTIEYHAFVDDEKSNIPLKETFESSYEQRWISNNPQMRNSWITSTIDGNTSMLFQGYNYQDVNTKGWLVSPILDLSEIDSAGMAFDVSYVTREGGSDELQILGSVNCGEKFDIVLETFAGVDIAIKDENIPWTPSDDEDWIRKEVSLKSLAHTSDARIAFVFKNEGVNNLYIDNIAILLGSSVEIKRGFQVFPNPIVNAENMAITFNLPHAENIVLEIINNMGMVVYRDQLQDILNQSDLIPIGQLSSGVYTVRVTASKKTYIRKFVCVR
jgi:hypothetical protein